MTTHPKSAPAPYWSLPGLADGAWRSAPLVPGTIVFSMAFGTIAAQKGLTLTDTVLMNALVFSGVAQFVAIEVWNNPLTLGTVLSLVDHHGDRERALHSDGRVAAPMARAVARLASLSGVVAERRRELDRRDPLPRRRRRRCVDLSRLRPCVVGHLGRGRDPGASARRIRQGPDAVRLRHDAADLLRPRCWCRSGAARAARSAGASRG